MRRFHRPAVQYSRWDGTQVGFDIDADALLGEIDDDLLYHGDLSAALRRLLNSGFRDSNGRDVSGIRDILERLRERRQQHLDDHDLGGVYSDIAEKLREVMDIERAALDEAESAAAASGDQRRQEVTGDAIAERRMHLDLVPPDLAGTVRSLQSYEFTSSEARERFDELVEQLRQDVAQHVFNQVSGAMSELTPEDIARMKDMFAELNRMLEDRAAGRTPDFEGFMSRYGDMFPENPRNLDELLEVLARRMAAAQAMLNSMTPAQRDQLGQLMNDLLDDLDLSFELSRLQGNLRQQFPDMGWSRRFDFEGDDPLDLAAASELMNDLGDLDQLEQLLRGASNPGALAEVDLDRARELLGDDTARSLDQLAQMARTLEDAGLVENRDGRFELTPEGLRRLGAHALKDLFSKLARDRFGEHEIARRGVGHERSDQTKPYEFGDPFNLHIERTVRNAVARTGGGVPVELGPDDFEVEETEHATRSATVLMVDLSLSMPMRDNFLAAKKVAMALHALITTRFPRDFLGMVGFSETARTIEARELPEVSWDYVYGTNMQHGFILARQMLAREYGNKQIIMVTDGEPTAHLDASGQPIFHYPPIAETVDATLTQVMRATREGITINTFMLDATPYLQRFIEQLTELNRGRAFFTSPETLGDYVLVDFLEQKRSTSRRSARSNRRAG